MPSGRGNSFFQPGSRMQLLHSVAVLVALFALSSSFHGVAARKVGGVGRRFSCVWGAHPCARPCATVAAAPACYCSCAAAAKAKIVLLNILDSNGTGVGAPHAPNTGLHTGRGVRAGAAAIRHLHEQAEHFMDQQQGYSEQRARPQMQATCSFSACAMLLPRPRPDACSALQVHLTARPAALLSGQLDE